MDLEGSGSGITEVLIKNFPGGAEEDQKTSHLLEMMT
jgi:hypothetical protein